MAILAFMSLLPHRLPVSNTVPLHSLLLSFGKGLLQRGAKPASVFVPLEGLTINELLQYHDVGALEKRAREFIPTRHERAGYFHADESHSFNAMS